jgi:hypothetical protein
MPEEPTYFGVPEDHQYELSLIYNSFLPSLCVDLERTFVRFEVFL